MRTINGLCLFQLECLNTVVSFCTIHDKRCNGDNFSWKVKCKGTENLFFACLLRGQSSTLMMIITYRPIPLPHFENFATSFSGQGKMCRTPPPPHAPTPRGVGTLWGDKALEGQAIVCEQWFAPPMLCLLKTFRRLCPPPISDFFRAGAIGVDLFTIGGGGDDRCPMRGSEATERGRVWEGGYPLPR